MTSPHRSPAQHCEWVTYLFISREKKTFLKLTLEFFGFLLYPCKFQVKESFTLPYCPRNPSTVSTKLGRLHLSKILRPETNQIINQDLCRGPLEIRHDFFLHPWKLHLLFLQYPWKFHILNSPCYIWFTVYLWNSPFKFKIRSRRAIKKGQAYFSLTSFLRVVIFFRASDSPLLRLSFKSSTSSILSPS